ncbi:MAG: DUF4345 domain-containing protein [Chloroflexota bacterium]|nr:DUF4345 domain-containing protein [Chloroflexota bacterium]MDE2920189.1 DUF4345 domain-containing protein [Chloroflexota bacterium]
MLLRLLRFVVLAATVASGLVLVVKPESVSGFTGLAPDAARGITEIRAAMGGVFIALGVAPLVLRRPAERVLGLVYLAIAAVRAPFMFADGSAAEQSNWISLAFEVAAAGILLAGRSRDQADKG